MTIHRFFNERKNIRVGSSVKLNDEDIRHVRKVLRLQKGDKIIIFNGESEYLAELNIVSNKFITAIVSEILKEEDTANKIEITLFQGLLKAGKIDLILQKATELGVSNIIPVQTEFSQSKVEHAAAKISRWQSIVLAASQQSERISIPEIHSPIMFEDIESIKDEFDVFYFFTLPKKSADAVKLVKSKSKKKVKKIAYFIGPEGGFSPKEHELAKAWGLEMSYFSENVLRSETAAIAGLSILSYLYSF